MKIFVWLVGVLSLIALSGSFGEGQTANEVLGFSGNLQSNGGAMTLAQGRDGKLYGTTSGGGLITTLDGTVFRVSTGGKVTTLHSFGGADGPLPIAGLQLAIDAHFYRTTLSQGSRTLTLLFRFTAT